MWRNVPAFVLEVRCARARVCYDATLADLPPCRPFPIPWQPRRFRIKEFADVGYEFVLRDGRVVELKQSDPSGEYSFTRK